MADRGRCGKCKSPLTVGGAPVAVSDGDFERTVLGSRIPVLLDCWADWCGPCHMLAPTIDALARDYAGRVLVAKLDVDANQKTTMKFNVRSIPALLFFKDGKHVDTIVGLTQRPALEAKIAKHLAA